MTDRPQSKRADQEADEQGQERALAAEPIEHRRAQEPGHSGTHCVRCDDQAELKGADAQSLVQLRSQRHDHHEINDAEELDRSQDQQQDQLAPPLLGRDLIIGLAIAIAARDSSR